MRKVFTVLLLLCLLSLSVYGEEHGSSSGLVSEEDAFSRLDELLPEDLRPYFSESVDGDTLSSFDLSFFIGYIAKQFSPALQEGMQALSAWIAMLLLCSLLQKLGTAGLFSETAASLPTLLLSAMMALVVGSRLTQALTLLQELLSSLGAFLRGILPIMELIYLAGGSATRQAVSAVTLETSCALMELCASSLLLPVLRSCIGFYLLSVIPSLPSLSAVSDLLQKLFLSIMGGFSALLMAVFAFQTLFAGSADSAASRALKFTAAKMIPVVGSSVSEAMKTMLSSLGFVKSVVGGLAIVVILLLSLPLLLRLLLEKLALQTTLYLSKFLQLPMIENLCSGGSRLYDFLLAILAMTALTSVIQMASFMAAVFGLSG